MPDETPVDPYGGQPYQGPYPPPAQYPPPGPYAPPYQPTHYPTSSYAYGPPPYGAPYPYPYPLPGSGRPGTATAAGVLAFVAGGLLIAAALLLFAGANVISDIGDQLNAGYPTTAEFTTDGLLNLVAAGLLIAGGVSYLGRSVRGRVLLAVGSVIVVACAIYWIARFESLGVTVFYALLFSALVVISLSMTLTTTARTWLHATPAPQKSR